MLLQASGSESVRSVVENAPVSRPVVARYVPGTRDEDAVRACRELLGAGLTASLDHLGEDTTDPEQARAVRDAYVTCSGCSRRRADPGRPRRGVGQALRRRPGAGRRRREDRPRARARDLRGGGGTPARRSPWTWRTTRRPTRPWRSCASCARTSRRSARCCRPTCYRTEADCRDLAVEGSRVRLCKGAYKEPESVAFARPGGRPVLRPLPVGAHGRPRATRWSPPTTRG